MRIQTSGLSSLGAWLTQSSTAKNLTPRHRVRETGLKPARHCGHQALSVPTRCWCSPFLTTGGKSGIVHHTRLLAVLALARPRVRARGTAGVVAAAGHAASDGNARQDCTNQRGQSEVRRTRESATRRPAGIVDTPHPKRPCSAVRILPRQNCDLRPLGPRRSSQPRRPPRPAS